jgi:hypothetical protein
VTSSTRRALLAALGGCVLLAVAAVYFLEPAHALPAFFPGHVGAGDAEYGHHHVKHGIAAVAVAFAAFAYAWFSSGPNARAVSQDRPATG